MMSNEIAMTTELDTSCFSRSDPMAQIVMGSSSHIDAGSLDLSMDWSGGRRARWGFSFPELALCIGCAYCLGRSNQ